jgi:hypothetical protein
VFRGVSASWTRQRANIVNVQIVALAVHSSQFVSRFPVTILAPPAVLLVG